MIKVVDKINKDDYKVYQGKRLYGRIEKYSYREGYGFIRTEDNKSIFFSSYDIVPEQEKLIHIGSICSFFIGINDKTTGQDKAYCAKELVITNMFPSGLGIQINDIYIEISKVVDIGIASAIKIAKERFPQLTDEDFNKYPLWQYKYLYINTKDGEYRFFNIGSFLYCDGQVEINKKIEELDNKLFKMDTIEEWKKEYIPLLTGNSSSSKKESIDDNIKENMQENETATKEGIMTKIKKLFTTIIATMAMLTLTACGSGDLYEENQSGYNEIISVDGVVFDMDEYMLTQATAIINISNDMDFTANDTYLYKDGNNSYMFFNMNQVVIAVKKGTSFNFEDAEDKKSAVENANIMNIWFTTDGKKLEYESDTQDDVYKAIINADAAVSITNNLFGDFSGKLAIVNDGTSEWAMFAGIKGTDYEDAGKKEREVIEHLVKSFHIREDYETKQEPVVINGNNEEKVGVEEPTKSTEEISNQVEINREEDVAYTSDIYKQLSFNDKGLCSAIYDNVDSTMSNNIITLQELYTGQDAVDIIKKACNKEKIDYEEAPEGCSYHVVKYKLAKDPNKSYVNIKLRGLDGENLCYRGIIYTQRTYDIFTFMKTSNEGYEELYCYYPVPNGCSEYTLECGEATIESEELYSAYYHINNRQ